MLTNTERASTLAAAVMDGYVLGTVPAGTSVSYSYQFGVGVGEWCEGPLNVVYIARSISGTIYDGLEARFEPADFALLEQVGPGICWGERDASYTYKATIPFPS